MKKLFFTFILVFCLAAGFAETGIDGTAWRTNRKKLNFGDLADNWNITADTQIVSFSTIILGKKEIECYIFEEEQLKGVCYCIPEKSVKELLTKLDKTKKVLEIKTQTFSTLDLMEKHFFYKKNKNTPSFYSEDENIKKAFRILLGEFEIYSIANKTEQTGYKNISKANKKAPGTGTLYIYDYNDDTRVYITAGNVDGLAFVAYVPHFKDY